MTTVKKMAVVPYTDQQMFELVNDVRAYPDFLLFCCGSEVLSQDDEQLCARLTFAKGGFEKSFTTRNHLTPYSRMDVHLVDGPFKSLEGYWKFVAMSNGYCKVEFQLEYEFSSKWLMTMFGPLFNQMAGSLVDTFCKQADKQYAQH